ncbi:MAG: DNA alkylation repair protein [Clostridia bacterium]|nr:DNA alkylation repair protein [Clostridia bacterium]
MLNIISQLLFDNQDLEYKKFHSRLMPTINPDTIIGVRIPRIRSIAKELQNNNTEEFLNSLPHKYYEENNLHSFLIAEIKDFDDCLYEINRFLPYIDNWATCDSLRPKCFKKNTDRLLNEIYEWLKSTHTYTLRFGIECLMCYYLDDEFKPEYPEKVSQIKSDEYYVNMMLAWYFATALAKQWDSVIGYIENHRLSDWVHNKTIQKAFESYRITDTQKNYLLSLKHQP